MIRTIPRSSVDQSAWDAAVEASSRGWLWHRYAFQDALATWPGRTDASWAIVEGDDVIGVFPAQEVSSRRARLVPWTTLESLGGPARRDDAAVDGAAAREQLLDQLRAHRASAAKLTAPPMAPANRPGSAGGDPLAVFGGQDTSTQTWVVDLRDGFEATWQRVQKKARWQAGKSERDGVTVRAATGAGDAETYYALHEETYRRTGATPHPRAYFAAIFGTLIPVGLAYALFAEHDGDVVAAATFGVDKHAAIYWTGASTEVGLDLGANYALQRAALEWMIKADVEWYEVGEAFPEATGKARGISDFKQKWGGTLHRLPRREIDVHMRARAVRRVDAYRRRRAASDA